MLIDNDEVIGEVVITNTNRKPIYVSIGNRVSLETAVKIIKHCSKTRIPEPLLQAHNLAAKQRNKIAGEKQSKYLNAP